MVIPTYDEHSAITVAVPYSTNIWVYGDSCGFYIIERAENSLISQPIILLKKDL